MPPILCAIDGHEGAARVLDAGRWLADALGEELVVAHAFEAVAAPMGLNRDRTTATLRSRRAVASERAKAWTMVKEATARLGERRHKSAVSHGLPEAVLIRLAEEREAHLLVAGPDSRSTLSHVVQGSVT